jgi:hypothetical protein
MLKLQEKTDSKFLAASCFVCDKAPVTALFLRDTIITPLCENAK